MGRIRTPSFADQLWDARKALAVNLKRYSRADYDDAEDAASEAMNMALAQMKDLEAEAALAGMNILAHIKLFMSTAANRALSKIRRARNKALSLDAPMSDEEESGDFGSNVVARTARFDPEIYCDAMKAVRLAGRLTPRDSNILVMLADGMTADDMALELGSTPGQVRIDRARLIRLMRDSFRMGADL
jgi:DNA-binding CsgD family transcriptional regulator